jgi:hypothetical protein
LLEATVQKVCKMKRPWEAAERIALGDEVTRAGAGQRAACP